MRLGPALIVGLTLPLALHGADAATPQHDAAKSGFSSAAPYTLTPRDAVEPLIRQATLRATARAVTAPGAFTDAPLPDDEIDAPRERVSDNAAQIRPDFFRRNHHVVGDALSGGAAVNDQRRGHGSMAAGLAVAIPMD
ncbi:hypothetical protein [Swaminathania salitolerans]|uniref:Uncharacterized protein n=1 Tax=Swaminathania salitolerans TaxID=182838 RepID=A0A511BSN5_9PROT|nr:hypothetical protein [Swaminathania salitolerans]GBQ09496.1 hypothetical protein AA21291_0095 [Swaminathania salitolerans LMG 21291]GEL00948.1 hypothetical protein SSA02_01110 [Swaminathania salitolerans]